MGQAGPRTFDTTVRPMLAKSGAPFDSDRHFFEIKWDGTRALLYVDEQGYRFLNRRLRDITDRYPELTFACDVPPGTVLDGEIVVLDANGKPSFQQLQTREQARSRLKFQTLSVATPATFVAFDQLYENFRPCFDLAWTERRSKLQKTVQSVGARLVVSDGIHGDGVSFFEQAVAEGLEGVVAKRQDSLYLPGRRSDAWIKIKRSMQIACAVIGFVPDGRGSFESLILASPDEAGQLRGVGRVGTGIDERQRHQLDELLKERVSAKPIIASSEKGIWIDPVLLCEVRFLERTGRGNLRAPVFVRLLPDEWDG